MNRTPRLALATILLGAIQIAAPLQAAPVTWTGAGGPPVWFNPGNWTSNPATPTLADDVTFTSPPFPGPVFTGGGDMANSLTFLADGYSLNGAGLFLGSGPVTNIAVDDFTITEINATVAVPISTASFLITKSGTDRLTIASANTFSSNVIVSAGYLNIQDNTALGDITGNTLLFAGATLEIQNNITVTDENLFLDGSGVSGVGALRSVSGTNNFAGNIGLTTSSRINSDSGRLNLNPLAGDAINGTDVDVALGGAGVINVFQPIFLGTGGLTKDGSGTVTLSALNSYSGPTTINDGTLVVNGDISFSSSTTVNIGATLLGSGSVGKLTANNGGTVAPGNSPGVLTAGNTTLENGSTFSLEINGTTAGTDYDRLNTLGSVNINSATLSISLGYVPVINDSFIVLANDLSDAITGEFSGLTEGAQFNIGLDIFEISYVGGSGNDVVLTVVPEPGTATMLLGGLAGLIGLRRRRA